ncbi:unnamed protein product, partial [Closterium sp. Yama58-4]
MPLTAPQDISALQCLNLSCCSSPSSPPLLVPSFSLAALPRLTELHLRGNRLTAFPGGFESLLSLRVLNLSQNQIESIPV